MTTNGSEPRCPSGSDDDLITTEQLAAMLSVPSSRLRKARVSGEDAPPFIKLGKKLVRYRLGDVRAWLASKPVVHSTSELPRDGQGR